MKFRTKTVIIDALQFNGSNAADIAHFCQADCTASVGENHLFLDCSHWQIRVNIGDWVIKESDSRFQVYSTEHFERLYERMPVITDPNLCTTCVHEFAICEGRKITWGIDVDPTTAHTANADKVLECDCYAKKSNN